MDSLNSLESIYQEYGSTLRYYGANDSLSGESNEESDSSEKRKSLNENVNNEESQRVEKYINLEKTSKIWAGTNQIINYKKKDVHEMQKMIFKHNNKEINFSTNKKILNVNNNKLESTELLKDLLHYIYQQKDMQILGDYYSGIMCLDISFNDLVEVGEHLLCLSNLKVLYLHSNKIDSIKEIQKLASLSKLKKLTVENNPVMDTYGKFYRPFVIHYLPQIKSLDFYDIIKVERNKSEIAFNTHKYKFNLE
ncbi:leucine-rich repeat protein [Plasmodium knowlesi strain H]|uniref:Leucine-rich repeat-containing protein 51 n=3 Tax=Plasmodium knowlesi TaxID=5850 RepID=A0A5K1VGK6_PLAKH|nr:leucine-rich repeat protein [Plasmodium knowlesi strain H]OTN65454.1 Leucine-rich repeat protein [Plasmodium knowlesi]CAA9989455.1 leucine-rich repeat protein [Plasmodium knowlesi strain H]SBO25095.1 leucine-rich repeat protein [Plasmodium knowlesi strain H]SBO27818.1 leucine-rich repeat protein [Plasmodium knowlesi strain H]VVS78929.1 leucine-rich repeat protein [Plasmodium knowlesi strain H]|eukprot:XP_002260181.1 hypothetical protein, conserved in Plasmodium species [Plasmodium knowlesi strain H]